MHIISFKWKEKNNTTKLVFFKSWGPLSNTVQEIVKVVILYYIPALTNWQIKHLGKTVLSSAYGQGAANIFTDGHCQSYSSFRIYPVKPFYHEFDYLNSCFMKL